MIPTFKTHAHTLLFQAINQHNTSIQTTTKAVHEETVRIVDAQMKEMASQMQALDDFVTRARSQNERHHKTHLQSLQGLSSIVHQSCTGLGDRFTHEQDRVRFLEGVAVSETSALEASLPPLTSSIQIPLSDLRQEIAGAPLKEYSPTGETPQKTQYIFATTLPRTEPHDRILAKLSRPSSSSSSFSSCVPASPNKTIIYNDIPPVPLPPPSSAPLLDHEPEVKPTTTGLREIDLNITANTRHSDPSLTSSSSPVAKLRSMDNNSGVISMGPPPLKRQATTTESKLPQKLGTSTRAAAAAAAAATAGLLKLEGRENAPLGGSGRRLRSSPLG